MSWAERLISRLAPAPAPLPPKPPRGVSRNTASVRGTTPVGVLGSWPLPREVTVRNLGPAVVYLANDRYASTLTATPIPVGVAWSEGCGDPVFLFCAVDGEVADVTYTAEFDRA